MTKAQNPTTTNDRGGHLRMPAPDVDGPCPKCRAENVGDRKFYVWRVADERGLHWECDVCAHSWKQ